VGNVIGIYNIETGIEKKLYWNAWNQLIRVEEGNLIWTAVYDGFGRRLLVRSEDDGQKAEKAKEEDILHAVAKSIYWRSRCCDITGLVNMGARYYHPASGRFISPDPYGHTGSLDLYNYAGGDPANYFDPDGRLLMASAGKVRDFSVKHGRVALDGLHFGLDVGGMVPVLGAVPDLVNAGILLREDNM